ncbi:MAG: OsmC family protein [Myxococcaceae bacterium]|jgi:putative redox protein|nr:OsmC family protein [Myxococcaceae bacterium]MCA3011492.1 OsmC family protein [Myxococcaceae bacterium]
MSAGVEMAVSLRGLTAHVEHGPSGSTLRTVPPKDNGGDGTSFSPTDLLGASLASCALTTMALLAAREGLTFGDATARVVKHMVGPPRRVGELTLELRMPPAVPAGQRSRLEEIARGCPVARSLHPDVQVPMTFLWPD